MRARSMRICPGRSCCQPCARLPMRSTATPSRATAWACCLSARKRAFCRATTSRQSGGCAVLRNKGTSMWLHKLILAGIIVLLGVTAAVACGIFFPWQLLDNRAATLKEGPANSFAFEATHLVSPPTDGLKALEGAPSTDSEEATEVSAEQLDAIGTMRSSKSGDEAFAEGAVLPAGIRLYTAGA